METFEKLQQVKEMITQLGVFYNYFKNYYKKIAIGLSKQQEYDAYSKAIQKLSFTVNLDGESSRLIFSLLKK